MKSGPGQVLSFGLKSDPSNQELTLLHILHFLPAGNIQKSKGQRGWLKDFALRLKEFSSVLLSNALNISRSVHLIYQTEVSKILRELN